MYIRCENFVSIQRKLVVISILQKQISNEYNYNLKIALKDGD